MNPESEATNRQLKSKISNKKHINRLKTLGAFLTIIGIGLFAYFVYTVGLSEIFEGVVNIGIGGFAFILFLYFIKLCVRAIAWKVAVYEPYKLDFKDTLPAVIIGEALSSVIPLGILISGTAKAVAVRRRVPLVVGLSSVATENLFYSLITGLFIAFGALAFLRSFEMEPALIYMINSGLGFIIFLIILGSLMVIRQWHWASGFCGWLYDHHILRGILERGRGEVLKFENLIYGFYRKHPKRFFPLCFLQIFFHLLGIFEVWFILTRISEVFPTFSTAFFLESMSRLVTIVFKLVPFLVGVDEASAEFVVESLAVGAGIGVTLAIIRKGRTIFWAAIGFILILKRELSIKDIHEANGAVAEHAEIN